MFLVCVLNICCVSVHHYIWLSFWVLSSSIFHVTNSSNLCLDVLLNLNKSIDFSVFSGSIFFSCFLFKMFLFNSILFFLKVCWFLLTLLFLCCFLFALVFFFFFNNVRSFFTFSCTAFRISFSQLGIEPASSAVKVRSSNHWVASEFPVLSFYKV